MIPVVTKCNKLFGRRKIFMATETVTVELLQKVLPTLVLEHDANATDIKRLYDIYRGNTSIYSRTKETRQDIINKVSVNHANEIVSFKTSYLLGEPMQLVARSDDAGVIEAVKTLDDWMYAQYRHSQDRDIAEWMAIAGVGVRLTLKNPDPSAEAPFISHSLDPRSAFVVYSGELGEEPLFGVYRSVRADASILYRIFARTFRVDFLQPAGLAVDALQVQPESYTDYSAMQLPCVPMVEYENNTARLGAFEPVLSILDTINILESNRVDAVEEAVQYLLVLQNMELTDDDRDAIKTSNLLEVRSSGTLEAKAYTVEVSLEQNGVQTLIDDLYARALSIVGMPSQQQGTASTSDTGAATIMRNGWHTAEARAKDSETSFKAAESRTLRCALHLAAVTEKLNLSVSDVEMKFTRRNYEDLLAKTQALTTMLATDKIHPLLAFSSTGMFSDSQEAFTMSEQWRQQMLSEAQSQAEAEAALTQETQAAMAYQQSETEPAAAE